MRSTTILIAGVMVLITVPAPAKQVHKISATKVSAQAKIAAVPALKAPSFVRSLSSSKTFRVFLPPAAPAVAKNLAKPASVQAKRTAVTAPTMVSAGPNPASTPTISGVPKDALARLTAYWTGEDYYTSQHMSSTGVRLQQGHCAVDPSLIPYGSVVNIPGMGSYRAVDTGSAVVSRQAAIGAAHNASERNALVVDLFFENRQEAEQFVAHGPAFVSVSWNKPTTATDAPLNPRALPAGPAETARVQVYVLESAPSLADCRLPLNFRSPTIFQ